ncbi:MAG TPA: AraC family transcriptional regulator [Paludibacteraceae bacterium]|nr:AraC family transcriptional regulator [Paludibacteraceae bacterium]HPH63891.1 AraC family transcriptional regulator [Paludibacteraceae bacterium]HQJ90825.1 AraC family transcriptional regulator [Paludibacteraceae bacterium]
MNINPKIIEEQIPYSKKDSFFLRHDHIYIKEELGYHKHPEYELQYVKKGQGVHIIGGISELCKEGEIILIPGNVPHAWYWDEKSTDEEGRIEEITIQFHPDFFKEKLSYFPEFGTTIKFFSTLKNAIEYQGECATIIRNTIVDMEMQSSELRLVNFFLIITQMYLSNEQRIIDTPLYSFIKKENERMDKIYKYILENYTKSISLEEIANVACMNKSAFCIYFKKKTGRTFVNLINEYRIKKACQLLCDNNKSISSISFELGFSSLSHFNKTFKYKTGVSPSNYRKQTQNSKKCCGI